MLQIILDFLKGNPALMGGAAVLIANAIIKYMPGIPHNDMVELSVGAVRKLLDTMFPPKPSA